MFVTEQESNKIPTEIIINKNKFRVEFVFSNKCIQTLSFEFLRVHSPSAEVVGHSKDQEVVQVGKKNIKILAIEPIGNYAVKPRFSDGHDTGIYSWSYLNWLLDNKQLLWDKYLYKIDNIGASREQN